MSKRYVAVAAAAVGAAALAVTGITYASAAPTTKEAPVPEAAPVAAPMGGDVGHNEQDRDRDRETGSIHFNERTFSADPGGCVTVVSGLGSTSFNVRNDSDKTVEVFTGVTCDNGAPIATVGPHSSASGVMPGLVPGGVTVPGGVVGSFRVVDNRESDKFSDKY